MVVNKKHIDVVIAWVLIILAWFTAFSKQDISLILVVSLATIALLSLTVVLIYPEFKKVDPFMDELVKKAKKYAIKSHKKVNQKYDGKSYSVHLKMVYYFGCKFAYLLPANANISLVLASLWVHDLIEDARKTYNDIKAALGIEVADIAYALTNDKGKTRSERAGNKYYKGILAVEFADYAKICDRLANVSYSVKKGSDMAKKYKQESAHFKEKLYSDKYKDMFDEMDEILKNV